MDRCSDIKKILILCGVFLLFSQICAGSLSCEIDVFEKEYKPSETVKGILNIENLNYTGSETNVLVVYYIESPKDEIIKEKTATIPLGVGRTKSLELDLPADLDSGKYFFKVSVEYLGEHFESQDSFFVEGKKSFPFEILVLILILGIGALLIYKYKL